MTTNHPLIDAFNKRSQLGREGLRGTGHGARIIFGASATLDAEDFSRVHPVQ